jgi:hypothetical protein
MTILLRSAMGLALLLAASALPAMAAPPDAEVEALQMPAWLVRDGQRTPLAHGVRLRNGDRIDTGAGSRVLLRLPDGSMVKLGEKARFSLDGVTARGVPTSCSKPRSTCSKARSASPPLRYTSSVASATSKYVSPPSPPVSAAPTCGARRPPSARSSR